MGGITTGAARSGSAFAVDGQGEGLDSAMHDRRSDSACNGQGKELDLALLDTGRQNEGMALLVAAVRPRWIVRKKSSK